MKLSKVSKKINILKGDIGDLQNRISMAMRVLEGNEYPEEFESLNELLLAKKRTLISLKNARMKANVANGMYEVILRLGEAKASLSWFEGVDVDSGQSRGRMYDDSKTVVYKSQISVAKKQAFIDNTKEDIEKMVDKLDEFNATTDITV